MWWISPARVWPEPGAAVWNGMLLVMLMWMRRKLIIRAHHHPDHKPAAVKRRSKAPRFAWGTRKRRRARSNACGVDVRV